MFDRDVRVAPGAGRFQTRALGLAASLQPTAPAWPGDGERIRMTLSVSLSVATLDSVGIIYVIVSGVECVLAVLSSGSPTITLRLEDVGDALFLPIYATVTDGATGISASSVSLRKDGG
jgi:hypothetical protein